MRKKVSLWAFLLFAWISIGLIVLFGWSVGYISNGGQRLGALRKIIIPIASFPSLVRDVLVNLDFLQSPLLLDDKYPNLESIRDKHKIYDDGYILLSSYDEKYKQGVVNFLRLSDSKILHTWILNTNQLKSRHISLDDFKQNMFIMISPLLLKDGSIVFQNGTPLINIDLHSNVK